MRMILGKRTEKINYGTSYLIKEKEMDERKRYTTP